MTGNGLRFEYGSLFAKDVVKVKQMLVKKTHLSFIGLFSVRSTGQISNLFLSDTFKMALYLKPMFVLCFSTKISLFFIQFKYAIIGLKSRHSEISENFFYYF